ncbi:hypothetical protein NIES37_40290 [Tolypothrix tenuis PCC 7101]|uniref:Uncharacterized protein n=1 Tax=Tolypothrix tenuis PCC 7101 TaxID=231146 RepID=A0A1Z4N2X7_9CYAN|nr:hypothetical protein NIES37_40290 [Tolypothrix tenuis PCC 7101]BAZ76033.1 hypothetical protein NIES50_46300 [Aulosira laxa NIES-50]
MRVSDFCGAYPIEAGIASPHSVKIIADWGISLIPDGVYFHITLHKNVPLQVG